MGRDPSTVVPREDGQGAPRVEGRSGICHCHHSAPLTEMTGPKAGVGSRPEGPKDASSQIYQTVSTQVQGWRPALCKVEQSKEVVGE